MPDKSHVYKLFALFLIFIAGLFLRIGAVLETEVSNPLRADAGQYLSYAYNLRHAGVYSKERPWSNPSPLSAPTPDALCTPGYPLFLLPFAGLNVTQQTILDITLVQALFSALLPLLVFRLGTLILPGAWPLLPALLTALSPQLVISNTYVLTETLFTFLLLAAITVLATAFSSTKARAWKILLAGMLVGLGALTRPTLNYYWVALLVPIWLQTQQPAKTRLRMTAILLAGCLLVYAPWTVRNLTTLGVTSDPTLAAGTLIHGSYPNYSYEDRPESRGYPYRFDPHFDRFGHSTTDALAEIWRRASNEPGRYLAWYLFGKPAGYLGWGDAAALNNIFTYPPDKSPYFTSTPFALTFMLMHLSHWLWIIMALAGIVISVVQIKRKRLEPAHLFILSLLSITIIYFLVIHMAAFPIARYNIPILPLIFILAIVTFSAATTRLNSIIKGRNTLSEAVL